MINGQKVVKVFCFEDRARDIFDKKNEELRYSAEKANIYANILMPLMNHLGLVLYILLAIIGGVMAIGKAPNLCFTGINVLSLGAIASFLQLSKSFVMPISQVSQQMSPIVMALAGAKRIFDLMDEQSEADDGYVTLVNAQYDKDGNLTESEKRTGIWKYVILRFKSFMKSILLLISFKLADNAEPSAAFCVSFETFSSEERTRL